MNNHSLKLIYAYPFDRDRRALFERRDQTYPSMEEVRDVTQRWQELWNETDEKFKVLELLNSLTKRTPTRNLECFVYGAGFGVMSTPFLLSAWNKEGMQWSDEKFIDLMIHELLHIFLSTENKKYWEHVRIEFSDEEMLCQNHILLYAMLYEIYQTLFNEEPLDWSRDNLSPGYARAIAIVKERGYKNLIAEYYSFA